VTSGTSATFNITPGPATQVAFAVQPSGTTAGTAIAPPVQVNALDAQGNLATGFAGSVTAAIGTNPGGGTLGGTTTVTAAGGVATFSTLSINKAGNGYTLGASATGLSAATSAGFTITAAPASHLVFSTQPTTTNAGVAMAPVQVSAQDGFGNLATTFTGTVTVVIGTNPAGGVLSGTTGVAAVGGVATFSTLSINNAGTGYTLAASATGLTGVTSASFNVVTGGPTKLVFTTEPTTTQANHQITPAVKVAATDALGNVITTFTGTITVAITAGTGAAGAVLGGTTSATAVNGVASFGTLFINTSGTSYALTATSSGLTNGTSTLFDIFAGPATRLAFTVQPTSTGSGAPITPAVQVSAEDQFGNVAPTFAGTVTVVLGTNPVGGTLSGTTSLAAVNGIATFSNLSIDKTSTGYALAASATGLTGTSSVSFSITSLGPTQLVFTVEPTTASANHQIAPAVKVAAEDALGNVVTSFTGSVTVTFTPGTGTAGAVLGGTTTIAAVSGVASFSTLFSNTAGTAYTLTATSSGLTQTASTPFDISAGPVTRLAVTVQPTTTGVNTVITPAVQVSGEDAFGNVVPSFAGIITVVLGTNPTAANLGGTTAVAAVNGVATFSTLTVDKAGTGYSLAASASGLTGTSSVSFAILAGNVTQLVFTVQPTSATANHQITPVVKVAGEDAGGNVVTSFTGSVTVAFTPGTGTPGAVLGGTTTITAVNGIASFSTLFSNTAGTGYTLTATSSGLTQTASTPFDIIPGPTTRLAFTAQPTTTQVGAIITPAVDVTAEDAFGNLTPTYAGTITVTLGTNPTGATLGGTTAVAAVNGVASFGTLTVNKSGTGYSLAANATGLTGTSSVSFVILAGAPTQLVFTVEPTSPTVADHQITPAVKVAAEDALNNVVTTFSGNVTLTLGGGMAGAVLGGTTTVTAVNGVASFGTLFTTTAGTAYTLTATTAGLSNAISTPFDITPAPTARLAFTVQPTSTAVNAVITPAVQVSAEDAFGNLTPSYAGTITVAIGTNPAAGVLSGTTSVAAVNGVATFNTLSINKSGTGYSLTNSATGLTGTSSASFAITGSGPASQLVFTVQPTAQTIANHQITPAVKVAVEDAAGNVVTTFTGSVAVAITPGTGTAGAVLGGTTSVATVNGVASFGTLFINTTGTAYTLTATSTGLPSVASGPFDIIPNTTTRLAFTVQPTTTLAGATITPAVQVSAQDAFGNLATGYTGTITVGIATNPGGGTLGGTTAVAAVNGVATFSTLSINKSGVGYSLNAAATNLNGTSSVSFTVQGGLATQLAFTVQPTNTLSAHAITPGVKVAAEDAVGNIATGFTGNITVALGTNPGNSPLNGTLTLAAVNGVANFTNLSVDVVANGYTLAATSAGLTGATSAPFNILLGPATHLEMVVDPITTTAGATLGQPSTSVEAQDAGGNLVATFTGNVSVAITPGTGTSGATLSGTTTVALVNGVGTFSNLSIDKVGTGYTLTFSNATLLSKASHAFNINPGAATKLAFTVQPANTLAGATIPAVQVSAEDALGNLVTTFAGSVTVAIGANPGGGTLSGTTVVTAVNGVATFSTLSINNKGTGYTLTGATGGLSAATSVAFNIQ
jgi:hypothetical protein